MKVKLLTCNVLKKSKSRVCLSCKLPLPSDGFCRNKNCEQYDDIALNYEAPIELSRKTYSENVVGLVVKSKRGIKIICPICKKPMEDGRFCYNMDCSAYDPLAQYFVPQTEDEIQQDSNELTKRIKEIEQLPSDDSTLPF